MYPDPVTIGPMTTPKPQPGTYTITLDVDTSKFYYPRAEEPEPLPDDELAEYMDNLPEHVYVYRIENSRHMGAYQTYNTAHIWRDDETRHPGPGRDGLGMVRSYAYHFGFESMDHFRAWFGTHELDCLNLHNLDCCLDSTTNDDPYEVDHQLDSVQHIVVLRVPRAHVVFGGHQLAFDNNHADRIMTLPLDRDLIGIL